MRVVREWWATLKRHVVDACTHHSRLSISDLHPLHIIIIIIIIYPLTRGSSSLLLLTSIWTLFRTLYWTARTQRTAAISPVIICHADTLGNIFLIFQHGAWFTADPTFSLISRCHVTRSLTSFRTSRFVPAYSIYSQGLVGGLTSFWAIYGMGARIYSRYLLQLVWHDLVHWVLGLYFRRSGTPDGLANAIYSYLHMHAYH